LILDHPSRVNGGEETLGDFTIGGIVSSLAVLVSLLCPSLQLRRGARRQRAPPPAISRPIWRRCFGDADLMQIQARGGKIRAARYARVINKLRQRASEPGWFQAGRARSFGAPA
jgi:hypothetical protein